MFRKEPLQSNGNALPTKGWCTEPASGEHGGSKLRLHGCQGRRRSLAKWQSAEIVTAVAQEVRPASFSAEDELLCGRYQPRNM